MPFLHAPTWHILDHSLELILGIASLGAQYCFEHRISNSLFMAGKTILLERLAGELDILGPQTSSLITLSSPRGIKTHQLPDPWTPIDGIRALIVLMGYASWEPNANMVQEAFSLQAVLVQVLRDVGLNEPIPAPNEDSLNNHSLESQWHTWIQEESTRRSKLIAFSFLHTHSIAYNVYPVIRSNEINLRLPCDTKQWKALTSAHWYAARREVLKEQFLFQDALCGLLKNEDPSTPLDPIPTPLGNYLLLHGLLQRIHIVRDLSLPMSNDMADLPPDEVKKLE